LSGIVHLGYVHQVTFLDAFEKAFPIRLLDFPKAILKADLYPYVHCAVESMRGLRLCSEVELSRYFNTLDSAWGFKATVFRRGFQA
jgi:hypothetical protein